MSAPAVSLAFYDPARELHGSVRSGVTLLFDGASSAAIPEAARVTRDGPAYHAVLEGRLDLEFSPLTDPVDLGGAATALCRVTGTAAGRELRCLGVASETSSPLPWGELDAVRALSAVFEEDHAVFVGARRPRGALGHDQERVIAYLLAEGEMLTVDDARLSTVYDAEGRQRKAGLELWLPGEDFPRRASGSAVAGTSLDLEELRVHAAVFAWQMEGREGSGSYDVVVRSEPPAAA